MVLPLLLSNQTQKCSFAQLQCSCLHPESDAEACQRAVVLMIAYTYVQSCLCVHIYIWICVYILHRYTNRPDSFQIQMFCAVLPVMSWPYTCSLLQCCFFSFVIWSLFSYCFCSGVALFKVFLCFLFPMAWGLHHSVLMLQHVNFAFNFNVQHAMKAFLFCLINICWSFHLFLFCSSSPVSPTPRRYIIFLDESNFCCLFIFQFI